jgi:serine/threonine protein kinase
MTEPGSSGDGSGSAGELPRIELPQDSPEPSRTQPLTGRRRGPRVPVPAAADYSELRRKAPPSADPSGHVALPVGYMLQEYRIEKVLGIGGFGVSYLALDINLDAKVAIKEYLPSDLATRNDDTAQVFPISDSYEDEFTAGLERFVLESRTLAAFHHHNIVRVARFFEANDTAYMVMEYEYGESLNAWTRKRRERGEAPLTAKQIVDMFEPLLQGLQKVHAAGFLHRDIKPANIYVRDADGSLVLLDFGAARQTASRTEGLTAIVTPGYAPLEQYHAHGKQGPWTDLYAVGGVLYWLVTGEKPAEAAGRADGDWMVPAVKQAEGKYGEQFLAAIDWALKVKAEERPQSVGEFLDSWAGNSELATVKLEPHARARPKEAAPPRRRALFVGAAAVLLAGAGFAAYRFGAPAPALRLAADASPEMAPALNAYVAALSAALGRRIEVATAAPPGKGVNLTLAGIDRLVAVSAAGHAPLATLGQLRILFLTHAQATYDKLDDLRGAKVAIASGAWTRSLHWLSQLHIPLDLFASFEQAKDEHAALEALAAGRLDMVALPEAAAAQALRQHGGLRPFAESGRLPALWLLATPGLAADEAKAISAAAVQVPGDATNALLASAGFPQGRAETANAAQLAELAQQLVVARTDYAKATGADTGSK